MIGDNLRERILQWDRRHGLLEERPARLIIEAPHATTASSSTYTTTTTVIYLPSNSASAPSSVATQGVDEEVIESSDESACGDDAVGRCAFSAVSLIEGDGLQVE